MSNAVRRRGVIVSALTGTAAGLAGMPASGATSMQLSSPFLDALSSTAPAPDRAEKMQLYGRFIGSWEMDVRAPNPGGVPFVGRGEIHFGWALEGRAIQDVWITPPRGGSKGGEEHPLPNPPPGRPGEAAGPVAFYGTTLRIYDPGIDAWHIIWSDPLKQYYARQIGRAEGKDILQEGTDSTGAELRWRFSEITDSSFTWTAHRKDAEGKWHLLVTFFARRVTA